MTAPLAFSRWSERRRTGAALYALALGAAVAMAPGAPVYWDTWGYVRQAIEGDVGGLGFGRPVFTLVSYALAQGWLAAGGSAWTVEPLLRAFWMLVTAGSAPLAWRLAVGCGLPPGGATLAGLAVALSPVMAHVAGTLLTDGPATTLLLASLTAGVVSVNRGSIAVAIAAGALLGLATGVREQLASSVVSLALMLPAAPRAVRLRLGLAMAFACAIAAALPVSYVYLTQPGYVDTVRGWLDGLAHDRAMQTFGVRDALRYLGWLAAFGPAVAVAALASFARRSSPIWRPGTMPFAVTVPSLLQLVSMAGILGMAYSPRYLAPAWPGALAIPGAAALDRWARASRARAALVVAALVIPVLVAVPLVRSRASESVGSWRALPSMLLALPSNAVVVTGRLCPAIPLVRAIVARDRAHDGSPPGWQPVCPGWAWPRDLAAHLDTARAGGRQVVLDLRPASWSGTEQLAALQQVEAYARGVGSAATDVVIWQ